MNAVKEATKDCVRDDCSLTASVGTSTCMSWLPTYDKNGTRTDKGDPNIHRSELYCCICDRTWSVVSQYGETTVTLQAGES